ncbi:hypothetical protein GALL_256380 [mine drainage metagenome]|uniref:Helix-turn-helix domain-containing protein n=1 Tax=mine drainage metagenome TaxID=410659 RepID=A0A1J5R9C4_9ZZZZ
METTVNQLQQDVKTALAAKQAYFTPLDLETRTAFNTNEAAFHLNRKNQTLRQWACLENGPIRPVRINGRLAWSVADVRNLLAGSK